MKLYRDEKEGLSRRELALLASRFCLRGNDLRSVVRDFSSDRSLKRAILLLQNFGSCPLGVFRNRR